MNRRGFISTFAAIAAGATLDQDRLLWRPGKLISIPRPAKVLLNVGDRFTIEGRYAVNPITREPEYEWLQAFIVS